MQMGRGDVINKFWNEELKKNPGMIILDPISEIWCSKNEAGVCYGTLGYGMSFTNKMLIANTISKE